VPRAARSAGLQACRSGALRIDKISSWQGGEEEVQLMRVMVIVKASKGSEAGEMPDEKLLRDMGRFNEELANAGIMLAGEGLHPTSKGKRVRFSGASRSVVDGPFAETKELIAGFWIWKVKSMDEAVEWVRRCPNPHPGESEIEIRPIFEQEDFGAEFTPELREQERRVWEKASQNR
jgi:hypothetical protein